VRNSSATILVVDDEASVRQHGASDYVTKPIGREMLHQALERALARLPG
jgi:DNA-binding response OmpR family regulator